jgi:uncharacterized protein (DUF2249 family)
MSASSTTVVDVRETVPRDRHPTILAAVAARAHRQVVTA